MRLSPVGPYEQMFGRPVPMSRLRSSNPSPHSSVKLVSTRLPKEKPMNECRNKLLRLLPPGDWAKIASLFNPERLDQGQVLHEPYQPIGYAHFFESGLSSEIATNHEGEKIEVGCIGHEGFSGFPLVLG